MIPLSVPTIQGNEWKYIKECLDTGWVSSVGSYVNRFEELVADYAGAKYATATVNGTSALHIGLLICGVLPGDEVIVPTLTFIAPVNVIKYCNAQPVFMDCDPETLGLDVSKTVEFLNKETEIHDNGHAYNKKSGRRVKAIIPVHMYGHPVDMEPLIEVCSKYNIAVLEDASESLGSLYKGRKTGGMGKVGCFSFNGNKIITTGGGGMIVTNDEELAKRAKHLTTQAKNDPLEYDHDEIGYNYRLTNIQAAMGVAQMEKLEDFIKIKRQNAAFYRKLLFPLDDIELIWEKSWAKSNFWLYIMQGPEKYRTSLIDHLLSNKIQVRPLWKLIHELPMYRDCQAYKIENAIKSYASCITLPCSVNIKEEEIEFVVKNLKSFLKI